MAVSKQSCTYTPTTHAAISGLVKSSSIERESLTTNLVTTTDTLDFSTDVANENQTIESYASTNAAEYEKSTSDEVFDNTISSKGGTEITTDTSDIFVSRIVQSSTSLYQENVVASEYQSTYSSSAAENIEYTSDQTFNKPSITDERSGTSVTPPPEASNNRTVIQTPTGEKATSSHEPGYELTSNYANNYFTKEGTDYHVKSETFNNSISAVYCTSPPNGTCAHTAYHYCDWAGWGTWSNCSNQCGSGTQERKRFICCPPEYNASSILQCVQQLCAHSVSDYIKHQSCTSSAGCKVKPNKVAKIKRDDPIKLLVLLGLVGVICGQCNDFNIQYQCLMNANQKLDACEKACPRPQYGCSRTRCQLDCQKQAYQRLTFCIIHE
uniref:Uncharacterized protein n=1 Tax=Magallana gigas TaxID=29159 RepID=K1Q8D6_MAGGI